jgi:hypothetical protein
MDGGKFVAREKMMTESKVHIKIGQVEFSGEGRQDWVAKQLDKIIAQADELIRLAPPTGEHPLETGGHAEKGKDGSIASMPLAGFLKSKNATDNQVRKFLATAVWFHAKGTKRLETKLITQALRDASQSRLTNAADALNKNIAKGHCEKDGKQFFVSEEGKKSL